MAVVGLRAWEHNVTAVFVEAVVATADVTVTSSASNLQKHRSKVYVQLPDPERCDQAEDMINEEGFADQARHLWQYSCAQRLVSFLLASCNTECPR